MKQLNMACWTVVTVGDVLSPNHYHCLTGLPSLFLRMEVELLGHIELLTMRLVP